MLPWQISFNEGKRVPIFDTLVDIIFVVDVVFGFHSGFIDPAGNIIDDLPTIRRHYLARGHSCPPPPPPPPFFNH